MKETDVKDKIVVEEVDDVSAEELKNITDIEKLCTYKGKHASQARLNRVKEVLGYGNPANNYSADVGEKMLDPDGSLGKQVAKLGFSQSGYRQFGVFFAYLMGVKDMSFEQAIAAVENKKTVSELIGEYKVFALSHLPEGPNAEDNVGQWVEMFKNCDKKFAQFKFPDVDYSNREDFEKWKHTMDWLTTVQINITQEYELLAKKDHSRKFIPNKAEQTNNLKTWFGFNDIGFYYQRAYNQEKLYNIIEATPKKRANLIDELAAFREIFHIKANVSMAGKSAEEVSKNSSNEKLYEIFVVGSKVKYNFKKGEAIEYLKGNKTNVAKEVKEKYGKMLTDARLNGNNLMYQDYNTFKSNILDDVNSTKNKEMLINFFANGETPQELCNNLKSEEMKDFSKYIHDSFGFFTGSDLVIQSTKMMNKKPMDLIKINGKTAYELWGDKYSDIKDPNDKEMLIQAEIAKEMLLGENEVTIDRYIIDEKNEFKFLEPYKATKNKETIIKEAAFFKGVNNLHERLCGLRDRLIDTQKDQNAIFNDDNKTTGSDSYQKMAWALKDCIQLSDIKQKGSGDYGKLEEALRKLKDASEKYYESHTGLSGITSGWRDNGKERINVSAELKNELAFSIETLRDLSYDIDVKRNPNYIGDFGTFNLTNLWESLKKDGHNKGIELTNEKLVEPVWMEVHDEISNASRKDTLRQQVMRITSVATREELMDAYIGGVFEVSPSECAKIYYRKQYLNNIRKADTSKSAINLSDIERDVNSQSFKEDFFNKVNELANNKDFAKMIKDHPKDWYARWNAKVRIEEKEKFNDLAENNDTYKQLLWADPENANKKWTAAEYRLDVWEREWKREDKIVSDVKNRISKQDSPFNVPEGSDFYQDNSVKGQQMRAAWKEEKEYLAEVLGNTLAHSFAKEQSANPSFMELALDPKQFEEVKAYIVKGLKEDLFSVKNNSAKMLERLNNYDNLKQSAKQYVKNGLDAKKATAAAKQVAKAKQVEFKGPHK